MKIMMLSLVLIVTFMSSTMSNPHGIRKREFGTGVVSRKVSELDMLSIYSDFQESKWDHPYIRVSYEDDGQFLRAERSYREAQFLVDSIDNFVNQRFK